jgi:rod shape-determining protein MreD
LNPIDRHVPWLRFVPATVFTLLLAVFSMQSFDLAFGHTLQILFILHAVYFWSMQRAAVLPAWLVFLLGFLVDLAVGRLLGLNAFLLVFVQMVVERQRRYLLSQPFLTQWAAFMLLVFCVEMLRWGVMVLVNMAVFSPVSALLSAFLCGALYPLTALVMQACHRLILPARTSETLE